MEGVETREGYRDEGEKRRRSWLEWNAETRRQEEPTVLVRTSRRERDGPQRSAEAEEDTV